LTSAEGKSKHEYHADKSLVRIDMIFHLFLLIGECG
jgi:hypothetical protein